jgi:hypothetical protein
MDARESNPPTRASSGPDDVASPPAASNFAVAHTAGRMSDSPEFEIEVSPPAPDRSASASVSSIPSPAPSFESEGVATNNPPMPHFGTGALLTGRGATVALVLASVLGFAASLMPEPYGLVVAVAAMLASGLAGAVAEVPRFAHGRQLVSAAMAPGLFGLGAFIGQHALTLPEGWLKGVLVAVSVACVAASGRTVAPGGVSLRRL